jgi:TraM recognition site of TraD and TraG
MSEMLMTKAFVKHTDRSRHIYLSGKTQNGKSTTMKALAYQDMRNGLGLCFIDAKGTETEDLLNWVPWWRRDDAVYLDLESTIPINFMACRDHGELMHLVSDIVQIFERFEDGLGVRMDALLRFTIVSLTRCGQSTFLDIYRFLTDEDYRETITNHPAVRNDKVLNSFWAGKHADKIINSESGIGLAFSRMAKFILSPSLQIISGTANATLNFDDVIQDQKIVLVKLKPKSDESILYGSLIVSKIQQAVFRRKNPRPAFALYVDEFQNFKSSGFEDALSMAGGLGLYLTLANQYFSQLSTVVQDAIINNVSTYFLFKMAQENAARLAGELKEREQPVAVDNRQKIKDLKEKIRACEKRIDEIWSIPKDDRSDPNDLHTEPNRILSIQMKYQNQLEDLQKPVPPMVKIKSYRDQLPFLSVGQAIYRAADGTTVKIKTPAPPPPLSKVGKTSHATYIKKNTIAMYRSKRPNRPVENAGCDTEAPVVSLEGNGNPTSSTTKDETIEGSRPPKVPPFQAKKRGSR